MVSEPGGVDAPHQAAQHLNSCGSGGAETVLAPPHPNPLESNSEELREDADLQAEGGRAAM